MMCISVLYKMCQYLYADHPLASGPVDQTGAAQVVVVTLVDGEGERFFVLSHDCAAATPSYQLCSWSGGEQLEIVADADVAAPDSFSDAVLRGVPFPVDGSLFGWRRGDEITALIAFYAEYASGAPEPCWSVMPLANTPERQWPSFPSFGGWFWKLLDSGSVVYLGDLIATTPGTVFWSDTEPIIGSGCCLVMRDIESDDGYTLRRGRYVHHSVLSSAGQVPPLDVLLTETRTTDLAPRFLVIAPIT
jgi:hypothetical protein